MAIITRGILGGFKGKVANVVGSSWKGRAVMKSLPLSVANPRTPAQTIQRSKFSLTTKLAANMLSAWIRPLWNPYAGDVSGYNRFVSVNTPLMGDDYQTGMSNLKFSVGGVTPVPNAAVIFQAHVGSDSVQVNWNSSPVGNQLGTDLVYVAIVDNKTGELLGVLDGSQPLSSGGASFSISRNIVNLDFLRCIVSLKRANGSDVSDSVSVTSNF